MKSEGRTYRQMNRKRQVAIYKGIIAGIAVLLCIIFTAIIFHSIFYTNKVDASGTINRIKQYVMVEVEDGDCLWSIAEEYKTDEYNSTREMVAEIESINGLKKDVILKPGNCIMVPTYVAGENVFDSEVIAE